MTEENGRRVHWLRDLLVPVVISIVVGTVVGVFTATIASKIAIAVVQTEVTRLKEDVLDLKSILTLVQANQIVNTRNEFRSVANERMVEQLSNAVRELQTEQLRQAKNQRDFINGSSNE